MTIHPVSMVFWAAVLGALFLAGYAVAQRRPGFLVAAAIVSLPPTLYLTATPRFWWAIALPIALCVFGLVWRRSTASQA